MKSEAAKINKIIRALIKNDQDLDPTMSVNEWKIRCSVNGITPSFDDDQFVKWLMCKFGQDFDYNVDFRNAVVEALNGLKFLDPYKNKMHNELLSVMLTSEITRNHDCFKVIGDYCIKNFPLSEPGKTALTLVRATGISNLSWSEIQEARKNMEKSIMSENHPHYNVETLSDELKALVNERKLTGPEFIGQGLSKRVGSDTYGYYICSIAMGKNKKPICGICSAVTKFHGTWAEGDEDCTMPGNAVPSIWRTTYGKTKSGLPKWWQCDSNGIRRAGARVSFSWNGAYSYKDPSF